MGTAGLKMFALGMNDEVSSLGRLALGEDFQSPQMGNSGGPAPATDPSQELPASVMRAPSVQNKWLQGMIDRGIDPVFARGMMPNIADESGWNTGVQEVNPTGRGGRGAYQLTGNRRTEFERRYGNDYSDENQMDFLAWEVLQGPESANYQRILKEAGGDTRKAAAGIVQHFLRPSKENMERRVADYLGGGSTMSARNYNELPVDTSAMEANAPDTSEAAKRRQFQGSLLMGLGQGISQIARGQTADMSGVMEAYYQRQAEARQRLMEIAREKRRQQEVNWNRGNEVADQERQIQAQQDIMAEAEQRDIRKEDRAKAEIETQAQQAQGLYGDLVPNAGDYYRVGGMDAVKDAATRAQGIQMRARTAQMVGDLADANPENVTYRRVADAMQADPSLSLKDAWDMFKDKDDPAAVQEFKFMRGLSDEGQQEYLKFKKAGGTSFNLGDTVQTVGAKNAFDELGKDRDAIRAEVPAYQAYKTLADLFEAYPEGKLPTGAMENLTVDARRYMSDLGLLSPSGDLKVGLQMAVNSLGSRLIGSVRVPGTGSTSDLEFGEFMKSVPGTAKPEIVNHIMTQLGINNHRYKEQVADLKEQYIYEHGNTVGFDKSLDEKVQNGELQASFYDTSNRAAMQGALRSGNLQAGDIIKGPGGQFVVLTPEGIDALMKGSENG